MNRELPGSIAQALENLPNPLVKYRRLAQLALERLLHDAATPMNEERLFISTGDIPAMWLRDSSFQVKPLIRFSSDPEIYRFISKVIAAQSFFIAIDPYANSFNSEANGRCWNRDFEDQSPWVFERKWEVDSLISHLQVSLDLMESSDRKEHMNLNWWKSIEILLATLEQEQNHDPRSYRFVRSDVPSHDYLSNDGYGAPFKSEGMIWSAFRPSDDACTLPFNIPQNAYAAAQLDRLAEISEGEVREQARRISTKIRRAIRQYGVSEGIYAYEVDCLGNQLFMDDANIPSLLSLPYLGFCTEDDQIYRKTREFVLSDANPWFFKGKALAHIGSQHTGRERAWPLAMAMEIITSADLELEKLAKLARTASSNGAFHESIAVDDLGDFTREWFSWAEMTFVDALFTLAERE